MRGHIGVPESARVVHEMSQCQPVLHLIAPLPCQQACPTLMLRVSNPPACVSKRVQHSCECIQQSHVGVPESARVVHEMPECQSNLHLFSE